MFNARKLCTAAALALCAVLPLTAAAQSKPLDGKKVLLLTAAEYGSSSATNTHYARHPEHAFKTATTALGGDWLTPKIGSLESTTSYSKSDIEGADIVVLVVDGNKDIPLYATAIEPIMKNRGNSNKTFILFAGNSESGGIHNAPKKFSETIKDVTGWDDAKLAHIPGSSYVSIPFKGNNTLATIFTGINKDESGKFTSSNLHGNTYGAMQCVPKDNVLYGVGDKRCVRSNFISGAYVATDACVNRMEDLENPAYRIISANSTKPAPLSDDEARKRSDKAKADNQEWKEGVIDPLHPDSASSLIVPQWQSKNGEGACIIFTIDESIFDRQGKPDNTGVGPYPTTVTASYKYSIFDHWTQLTRMAEALLKAAVDERACLQKKPAESVFAPAYNGAKEDELAIVAGGSVSGRFSDNRDEEVVDATATYDPVTNTCSQGEPCRAYANAQAGKCCSKALPDDPNDLPKSCPTNFMYCSAENVGISQAALSQPALPKNVCCSADKTADNSKGNLCCDADNPQPTGEPGSQICCKAGQINDGGKCVTPPTPVCTDGQAISTGCTCAQPMVVQNGVCISSTPICKPPTGCSGPSAPTTGWPALLGLSALLPLLAARRQRK